jgi:hypothetical protein
MQDLSVNKTLKIQLHKNSMKEAKIATDCLKTDEVSYTGQRGLHEYFKALTSFQTF